MEFDPLKPIIFKELSSRDKLFLIIMIALVIVSVTLGRGCNDTYYYDDESSHENYSSSPTKKDYEDAFRESDRAQKYFEEYNMKKKIQRDARGF